MVNDSVMTKYQKSVKEMLLKHSVYNLSLWRQVSFAIKHAGVELYPVGDGHDRNHIFRVMQNVIRIQKEEGGDLKVLLLAAVLHDIHWHMGESYVDPKDSMDQVSEILSGIKGVSIYQRELIMKAIKRHEIYYWHEIEKCTDALEVKILRDADNLDAIGAIGCGRTFAFGAVRNIPEYDMSLPPNTKDYKYGVKEISTLHHIEHKLLRLGVVFHTDTARRMAESRMKFIRLFYKKYIEELRGER